MKIFYEHLIVKEEISRELRNYHLTVEEHIEIMRLTDESIHIEVLDIILSDLPTEKHKEFLEHFHSAPHDKKLLDYLKPNTQDKIKKQTEKIKNTVLSEIKKAHKK